MQFNFEVEEMNGILVILAKQPYEQVASIIEKIRGQAMSQTMMQAPQQPAPTEVDKDAE